MRRYQLSTNLLFIFSPMSQRSDDTKKRLVIAAAAEFAEFGIAGARVDRIADAAMCNKQLIYAYFESKDGLATAVIAAMVDDLASHVKFDAEDLAGYAVQLFDYFQAKPDAFRLASWYALEGKKVPDSPMSSTTEKVRALASAQKRGTLATDTKPEILLTLVITLAKLGAAHEGLSNRIQPKEVRQAVHDAVLCLTRQCRHFGESRH